MDGGGEVMSFYLFGTPDEALRLKSFSGASRSGKMVIRIEVETADAWTFAYNLERLAEVQTGQRTKPKPAPKPPKKAALALPAPQLALPRPEGGGE